MAKEICAVALLVLILATMLINIWYLDGLVSEILEYVDRSEELSEAQDYSSAAAELETAVSRWREYDGYTHIFIRHSELDNTVEAFYAVLGDLYAGEGDKAAASFELLRERLKSTADMERVTIGSIF